MLLTLVILARVERERGCIPHPEIVHLLSRELMYSERHARNLLAWLREEGLIEPLDTGEPRLTVTAWRITDEGWSFLERLGVE